MPQVVADRIKEVSTTTGAGTVVLAGAVVGFRAFSAVCANNDTFYYCIDGGSTGEWEVGYGTWTTGGNMVRTATGVYTGSAGVGVLVNFSAGTKTVFITAPAEQVGTSNVISSPTTIRADTSYIVASYLTINSDLTVDGNLLVTG
jgi:hypothetical protein